MILLHICNIIVVETGILPSEKTLCPCIRYWKNNITFADRNMARHNETGRWGEKVAYDILVGEGYAIVDTNWRLGRYEIDIIAMKGAEVVFAEVKTRSDKDDDPLEAVDRRKMMRMVRSAEAFCGSQGMPHSVRFDLFAISGTPDDYTVEHIADAFQPPLKTY